MSAETTPVGPYTSRRHESAMALRWVIDGPTDPHEWFLSDEQAQKECDRLNRAFAAGQASREQWIPVSERLPELKDVGNEWSYSEEVITLSWVIEQDGTTYCKVAQCQKDPQGRIRWIGCKPFAWMPIPLYTHPQ